MKKVDFESPVSQRLVMVSAWLVFVEVLGLAPDILKAQDCVQQHGHG